MLAAPSVIGQSTRPSDKLSLAGAANEISSANFAQITLKVDNMTCVACPATVKKALLKVPGVQEVKVHYSPPQAIVSYNPATTTPKDLIDATTAVGYPSSILQ